jgi:hypothetical protein
MKSRTSLPTRKVGEEVDRLVRQIAGWASMRSDTGPGLKDHVQIVPLGSAGWAVQSSGKAQGEKRIADDLENVEGDGNSQSLTEEYD